MLYHIKTGLTAFYLIFCGIISLLGPLILFLGSFVYFHQNEVNIVWQGFLVLTSIWFFIIIFTLVSLGQDDENFLVRMFGTFVIILFSPVLFVVWLMRQINKRKFGTYDLFEMLDNSLTDFEVNDDRYVKNAANMLYKRGYKKLVIEYVASDGIEKDYYCGYLINKTKKNSKNSSEFADFVGFMTSDDGELGFAFEYEDSESARQFHKKYTLQKLTREDIESILKHVRNTRILGEL